MLLLLSLVIASAYVIAPGFARSLVGHSLLAYVYPISDEPADTPIACRQSIVGSHYFGDFQSEYCRLRYDRAYGNQSTEAVERLLARKLEVGNEDQFAEYIQVTPTLLPKLQWTVGGSPKTEWVTQSRLVNIMPKKQSEIGLVSEPIRVRLRDPVMVSVFISSVSATDRIDESQRLTIEWLNSQGEIVSSSSRNRDSIGRSQKAELQLVDAPPRDGTYMRMRVAIANPLDNEYEFQLPTAIYRLNSFNFGSIQDIFGVAEKVRKNLIGDPDLAREHQSAVDSLVDGILRGLIEPDAARSALAQADVVPGTRQFPSYFLHLLPLLLLSDPRTAYAIALLLVGLTLYLVLRRVSAKRFDLLLLIPSVGYAIWRGNLAWVVATALTLLWLAKFARGDKNPLLLLGAAALKPNLLLFAIVYLSRRNYKQFMTCLVGFVLVQIASGLLFMEKISDVRHLVAVTTSSSTLFGADDQRIGMRSDFDSLVIGAGRYVFSKGSFWIPNNNGQMLISIVRIAIVVFICLLALILGKKNANSRHGFGALAIVISAVILLFSPPTFAYSLQLVGIVPVVYDFSRRVRFLIATVLIPIFVPLPLAISLPPSFVFNTLVRWPEQPGAWTHWSVAGVASSCALLLLFIDRSMFLLVNIANSREPSELCSTETR